MRLDCFIAKHWASISRQKAIELIKQGQVLVNNSVVCKPSLCIQDSDTITIKQDMFIENEIFCSRAALKLHRFLHHEPKDCLFLFCQPPLFDESLERNLFYTYLIKYIALETSTEPNEMSQSEQKRTSKQQIYATLTPKLLKQILQSMIQERVILDVGASAGGFTQVLLAHGARLVIAQDVGNLQLSEVLRKRTNVLSFENVDIRIFANNFHSYRPQIESHLHAMGYKPPKIHIIEFLVCDVSFISLACIVPHLMSIASSMLLLFKPQYEVGAHVKRNKKGVVQERAAIKERLHEFITLIKSKGAQLIYVEQSLLDGKEGNEEFFIFCQF